MLAWHPFETTKALDDCSGEVLFHRCAGSSWKDSASETMVFDGFSADARISIKTSPRVTL